jgi:hypothetical protein
MIVLTATIIEAMMTTGAGAAIGMVMAPTAGRIIGANIVAGIIVGKTTTIDVPLRS